MLRFISSMVKSFSPKTNVASSKRQSFRLEVESLEDRTMMSAASLIGNASTGIVKLPPPAAPVFLATEVAPTQINLSWKSVAGATGYHVNELMGDHWMQVASTTGLTATVSNLTTNSSYLFTVDAFNTFGATAAASQSVMLVDHPAANGAYTVVSGKLFGTNGPSYMDVQQGSVGDCWLLASLAEVAARRPDLIKSMFSYYGKTSENGASVDVYTVRLYDANNMPLYIAVDTELPGGGSVYDHPANGVLWVALAEKAYAQANAHSWVTTNSPNTDSYAALDFGDPRWALQAFVGQYPTKVGSTPTEIAADWNSGDLVVLSTTTAPASQYIVATHAYAVVGYNASKSQPFTLYNPWGTDSNGWALKTKSNGQKVYGKFNADATLLNQNFNWAYVGMASDEGSEAAVSTVSTMVPSFATSQETSPVINATRSVLAALQAAGQEEVSPFASVAIRMAHGTDSAASFDGCDLLFADLAGHAI